MAGPGNQTWSEIKRKQIERYKANGQCVGCREPLVGFNEHSRCMPCTIKLRENAKKQRRRLADLAAKGGCGMCGAPAVVGRKFCEKHLQHYRDRQAKRRDERLALGVCALCGSPDLLPSYEGKEQSYRQCRTCYLKSVSLRVFKSRKYWHILDGKLTEQRYRCPYTGEQIVLGVNDSLDHKMPRGRYPELTHDPSNVEWVLRKVNFMKWDMTRDEFLGMVERIHAHVTES